MSRFYCTLLFFLTNKEYGFNSSLKCTLFPFDVGEDSAYKHKLLLFYVVEGTSVTTTNFPKKLTQLKYTYLNNYNANEDNQLQA